MPRICRENQKSYTGVYHVIFRSINQQEIFYDNTDRRKFLKCLKETKEKYNYELYAYVLMHNHIHLVIKDKENNLSKAIQSMAISYALYFNKRYNRIGHVFYNRFKRRGVALGTLVCATERKLMKVSDFNYDLPKELIAQVPIQNRDQSRLMILDRKTKEIDHKIFKDIVDYLEPGDCLVRNNTKVIPARLYGVKEETGAHVEFLLLHRIEGDTWEVMVKPGRKLMPGTKVIFGEGVFEEIDNSKKQELQDIEGLSKIKGSKVLLRAEILEQLDGGSRKVKFEYDGIFNEILNEIGLMPLPPYIHEKLKEKDRYQTVYAKYEGSAAAPTAGLHFTDELLEKIKEKGVEIANVTLHVGIGTFRPVKVENVEEHDMHSEHFYIKQEDAEKINKAKREGHRIIAVGTTSCRVLESIADENGFVKETEDDTNIFIYPGYQFKCLDCLITNFHLPESTLIMLVSALAGKDFIMKAYKEAVKEKYRFFSFGDAMFIKSAV